MLLFAADTFVGNKNGGSTNKESETVRGEIFFVWAKKPRGVQCIMSDVRVDL